MRVQNYSPTIIGRAIIISRHRLNRPTSRPAMVVDHLDNLVEILRAHSPHNPIVSCTQFGHDDRTVMVNALQHGNRINRTELGLRTEGQPIGFENRSQSLSAGSRY